MDVRLEAVKFNHNPDSATSDALSIRRNAAQSIRVPEWQVGISSSLEDSLAAYALNEVQGQTISIHAQFRVALHLGSVEIRAVDPLRSVNSQRSGEPSGLGELLVRSESSSLGNVLGEVRARTVDSVGGLTGFEAFELENVNIEDFGVGVWANTWIWQYRLDRGAWVNFETTQHRIYTVMGVPSPPWGQIVHGEEDVQLPWTDVLDFACIWAAGAKDIDDASSRVTRSVNNLGGRVITYDCRCGGKAYYCGSRTFRCTRFLERLRGNRRRSFYVNCTDCAAIVSTFANALGANLSQSRMRVPAGGSFRLNPIRLIGSPRWDSCLREFSFHEVAWKDPCDIDNELFDACVQIDGDVDPSTAPHMAQLPTNLKFGAAGAMLYGDRLIDPRDRPKCRPNRRPQRRTVI